MRDPRGALSPKGLSTTRHSRESSHGNPVSGAYQGSQVLAEILEPSEPVKVLPLKARKVFKQAMKELDQIDIINSHNIPMSRPKIRAILKKMRDNLYASTQEGLPEAHKNSKDHLSDAS